MILLASRLDGFAQFITVILVFILVLFLTAYTTKWIAGYQKKQGENGNIQVLESFRLSNSKMIQIVRIGETYVAIAVCKDTVSVLCELSPEQLKEGSIVHNGSFRDLLDKALKKTAVRGLDTKESHSNEEKQL